MQAPPKKRPIEARGAIASLWTAAGCLCVALGLIGAALPLLPSTVFMLCALYCFGRGSPSLHAWLARHPRFGPALADWREHGAIARSAKRSAALLMAVALALCWAIGFDGRVLILQGLAMLAVSAFLFTRPEPPERD